MASDIKAGSDGQFIDGSGNWVDLHPRAICSGAIGSGVIGSSIPNYIGFSSINDDSIYISGWPPDPVPIPPVPPKVFGEKERLKAFLEHVNAGTLKRYFEPRYDTLKIKPGLNYIEHNLFTVPVGQDEKTGADTNMTIGGMLGTPLYGWWEYIHVHFDMYHNLQDALRWMNNAEISLVNGYSEAIWRGSPCGMVPILPRGGKSIIGKKIKTGIIRFWPWLEAPIETTLVDSCDAFYVRVQYKEGFRVEAPLRIKFSLGPNLYRPY